MGAPARRGPCRPLGSGPQPASRAPDRATDLESAERLNATVHGSLPRTTSSGSTTSSARRPRRTSSRCASRTACRADLEPPVHRARADRRSGDPVRERPARLLRADRRLPRQSGDPPDAGARVTAMEPPTRPSPGRSTRKRTRSSPRRSRSTCVTWCAASTRATDPRRASPGTPRPRPSSRCAARSTTGAGRACRSPCEPARAWPRGRGSSRSRSGSRRARCSRPARESGGSVRITSRSTSPRHRACRCRSTASGPAPG